MSLARGEAAELTALEGEVLRGVFPRPIAPGAPIAMEARFGETPRRVEGKCIDSKRREDGRFDVRMRTINLRRDTRELLVAALGPVHEA